MSQAQSNVRLWRAIKNQFGTVAKLCRQPDFKRVGRVATQKEVLALIRLEKSPIVKWGRFSTLATTLSEVLDILAEELFPVELYLHVLPEGVHALSSTSLSAEVRRQLIDDSDVANPATKPDFQPLKDALTTVLTTLAPREVEILETRFGLKDGDGLTLEEAANKFKEKRDLIRQIEAKAVRKLQQPQRSQELVDFLD